MNRLNKYPKDFELYIFKDLDALTFEECRDNVLLLEYLAYKEVNNNIREKFKSCINQLSNRLTELSNRRQAN